MRFANGRADLVRALTSTCPVSMDEMATLLGYQLVVEEKKTPDVTASPPRSEGILDSPDKKDEPGQVTPPPPPPVDMPFWMPTARFSKVEPERSPPALLAQDQDLKSSAPRGDNAPEWPSLATKPDLMARVRGIMGALQVTSALDIAAAVSRIATARQLDPMPRRKRRRWGRQIQIVFDRSRRLTPFWDDQVEVYHWLIPQFPCGAVQPLRVGEGETEPMPIGADAAVGAYCPPPPGTIVLVLGDLGCLATDAAQQTLPWLELGKRLRMAGCVPVALAPCGPNLWPAALRAVWDMLPWERGGVSTSADPETAASQLLSLLSLTIRVEPGLLRQVRRLPGAGHYDAAAEAAFWQHGALTSQSSIAATMDSGIANDLRQQYWRVDAATPDKNLELMQQILALVRHWRPQSLSDVWFEEVLSLPEAVVDLLPVASDHAMALDRFTRLSQMVDGFADPQRSGILAANLSELFERMPADAKAAPKVGAAMDRFRMFVNRKGGRAGDVDHSAPASFDPANVAPGPGAVRHRLHLHHQGGHLRISPPESAEAAGSPLADISSVNGIIAIAGAGDDLPDPRALFWAGGSAPRWARDWGYDRFGAWACFTIAGVTQRLRWIVPGRFLMGSPADELARWNDEGPVHEVVISQGFWLFDTPCTQALWQAVMGGNPSKFLSPDQPVEQVSWDDAQGFMARIKALVPDLSLCLPTEAQWEYACRAGTQTALYTGPIDIEGDENAPALDPIAWYRGNSKGKAHPVGMKAPNGWGLYDMLGNVWEWCADGQRYYSPAPLIDPIGGAERGADRSLRGGGWFSPARNTRAACRIWDPPDNRDGVTGFRCALGQVGPEGAAVGSLPHSPRPAERLGAAGMAVARPGAAVVEVGAGAMRVPLPATPALIIRSDCEELHLTQITRPDWASAIGRDRFGLWTQIDIAGAKQRLRWIAPGRFLMGSPVDEPGRHDDEGPVHEVTISKGFWLFDTPCTQALWHSVMGENPSQFQSPARPVEQVSWKDAQGFMARINDLVPGLSLSLPTEAQWEYACRAGTQAALYTGPIDIVGEHHAPALDPIAWYRGNSKGETHPVGMKASNDWGLYDMLGNVWEWCADGRRDYSSAPLVDPIGETEDGGRRSLRGGSWGHSARSVRAAFRDWSIQDGRYGHLGFRCTQGQVGPEGGAERSFPLPPRLAERPAVKQPVSKKRKK